MYRVMHSDRGYFIGFLEMGWMERISEEFYASLEACQQALRDNTWTRRQGISAID